MSLCKSLKKPKLDRYLPCATYISFSKDTEMESIVSAARSFPLALESAIGYVNFNFHSLPCNRHLTNSQRRTFSVHKALLQKYTKHFDTTLASEAGKQGLIFLNEEDPEVFKMLYDWLYTGKLPPFLASKRNPLFAFGPNASSDNI
jgi:hypothetical protein